MRKWHLSRCSGPLGPPYHTQSGGLSYPKRGSILKSKNQRTMTICVPNLSAGNLGHGHRSPPPQEKIFRGP